MADASSMTDEELEKVVTTGVEPDEPVSTPTPDEPAEEAPEETTEVEAEPEPVAEEAPQEESEEEAPEVKPPSRRESLRIQQLIGKMKQQQPAPQPSQFQRQEALDYQATLDADPEVIQRLEADRAALGQAQYNAGLEQAKSIQFHTRLEIDAPRVESKYKFLDPSDKEHFDPVRADAMNTLYLNASGYDPGDPARGIPETVLNPNVRYKDFVEAQMEFAEALLADKQVRSSKNIAKQAATTGLRPDGSSAKRLNLNRAPQEMTMEELYASIGQTPPKQSK